MRSFLAAARARAADCFPATYIEDVPTLLAGTHLPGILPLLGGESLSAWAALVVSDRPAFLRRLTRLGVSVLADRQKIANVLGHAIKSKLVAPHADDLRLAATDEVTAAEALRIAKAALLELRGELRSLDADDRAARLDSLGLPGPHADFSASSPEQIMRAVAPLRLTRALEVACALPPAVARVLPEALQYSRLRVAFYIALGASASPRAADVCALDYAECGEALLGFQSYAAPHAPTNAPEVAGGRHGVRLVTSRPLALPAGTWCCAPATARRPLSSSRRVLPSHLPRPPLTPP